MIDLWQEIYSSVKRNKLRTALTGFAVAWGIFMLIVLLGAGNGLMHAFEDQSKGLDMNSMRITPGWTSMAFDGLEKGRRVKLDNQDLKITEDMRKHVANVGATLNQGGVTLSYGPEYVSSNLQGVFPNHTTLDAIIMKKGRFINAIDINEKRKVIIINDTEAETLFKKGEDPIGKKINANGIIYTVVGIREKKENTNSSPAIIPFTTMQLVYNKGAEVERIVVSLKNLNTEEEHEAFEKQIRSSIGSHQRFDKNDKNALWIWNRATQSAQQNKANSYLHIAIWVVGIFTLLSGIVGVSNIMLITVKERTREFGIRKALGAKPLSILWLVVVESVTITTIFGYVGLVCGIAGTEYLNYTAGNKVVDMGVAKATIFLDPTVDMSIAIQATLLLIIAGTIAGLIPSIKAARIRPIEALRAE